MRETRARKHTMVINNPDEKGMTVDLIRRLLEEIPGLLYACGSDEIGDEGTFHRNLFIQTKNQMRFSTVRNLFPGAHIEVARGSASQNRAYFRKEGKHSEKAHTLIEGTFWEQGDLPEEGQGRRTDNLKIAEMIKGGMGLHDILNAEPQLWPRIQSLQRAIQVHSAREASLNPRDLKVRYVWGPTGGGKTYSLYDGRYKPGDVCRVGDYKNPFDEYEGQSVLVLDEFYGQIEFSLMLKLSEGYPLMLPSRYVNRVAAYTELVIISNLPIDEQYRNVQLQYPKGWEAFRRRFPDSCIEYVPSRESEQKVATEGRAITFRRKDGTIFDPVQQPLYRQLHGKRKY